MQPTSQLYFKGLNGLRFFAALLVLLSHAVAFITPQSAANVYDFRSYSLFNNGSVAVDFFFVLSGFLIMSLLLQEQEENGTVSIKKFYVRRILRIWPLYYAIVFIGFAIFPLLANIFQLKPDTGLTTGNLVLYIVFLPNLTFIFGESLLLSSLWSIGVEEQFYLVIAPLAKYCKQKLPQIFIVVIILKLLLNVLLEHYMPASNLIIFVQDLRFEVISIGCLGAMYVRKKKYAVSGVLFSYAAQLFFFLLLVLILFFNKSDFINANIFLQNISALFLNRAYNGVCLGLLFLYIMVCISLNTKTIISTENKILNFLGNISYGMYMYHIMCCLVAVKIVKVFLPGASSLVATICYYLLAIVITITVSYLSYVLLEKRFLKLKKRFA